jgi:hypothetical protein
MPPFFLARLLPAELLHPVEWLVAQEKLNDGHPPAHWQQLHLQQHLPHPQQPLNQHRTRFLVYQQVLFEVLESLDEVVGKTGLSG